MANPKRKISRSKRDKRRANWRNSLKAQAMGSCDHCGEPKLSHRACPSCGYYHGRSIFNPASA
jgi:large subunit ribosomal protein L32